jgi:NAD(P)-dependent dehydrogenase (short-subunit alcohol dehydrogenase family)
MSFSTAIITGSESGIGRATAVALARRGLDIGVTWHVDEARARETVRQVNAAGGRAEVAYLDASRPEQAARVVGELADALGGVDVLVNNAAAGHASSVLDVTLAEWRTVVDTDLVGAFFIAQEAARRMVAAKRGGRIVNVTSVHEHVPLLDAVAYVAAKHGLGGVTKVMALELAEHGITVNSIAPGEIATAMTGNEDVDPRTLERPAIPVRRPGDPREVAEAIAYLVSPEASYTTGASLVVDGGLLLTAAIANQAALRDS